MEVIWLWYTFHFPVLNQTVPVQHSELVHNITFTLHLITYNRKVHLLLLYTMTNKCRIISQMIDSFMFRHYCITLRELVINTLPSYTSVSSAAVGNTVKYNTIQIVIYNNI